MERKDFFKGLGFASVASLLPFNTVFAEGSGAVQALDTCPLIPAEMEGPFPYPGGEINNPLNQVDIRAGQTGIVLNLTLTVVSTANCAPIPGARVDIWHCNKDGWYSGYNGQIGGVNGNGNYQGQTWLRGYQLTDANGEAKFTTIYPGWYNGRATHIHMEVFIGTTLYATGQMAFPDDISDDVHVTSHYSAHGINTTRTSQDGIFNSQPGGNAQEALANEMLAVSGNTTDGYTGVMNLGINYTPVSVIEPVAGKIAIYPNPATEQLILSHPAADNNTTVKVVSLDGRVIAAGKLQAGITTTRVDVSRFATGVYVLVVETKGEKQAVKFTKQ